VRSTRSLIPLLVLLLSGCPPELGNTPPADDDDDTGVDDDDTGVIPEAGWPANGSFEELEADGRPAAWAILDGNEGGVIEIDGELASDGSNSLRWTIDGEDGWEYWVSSDPMSLGSGPHLLRLDHRVDALGFVELWVLLESEETGEAIEFYPDTAASADTWTPVELEVDLSVGGEWALTIDVIKFTGAPLTFWLDDVSLVRL